MLIGPNAPKMTRFVCQSSGDKPCRIYIAQHGCQLVGGENVPLFLTVPVSLGVGFERGRERRGNVMPPHCVVCFVAFCLMSDGGTLPGLQVLMGAVPHFDCTFQGYFRWVHFLLAVQPNIDSGTQAHKYTFSRLYTEWWLDFPTCLVWWR